EITVHGSTGCFTTGSGIGARCEGSGWVQSSIPGCGVSAQYRDCGQRVGVCGSAQGLVSTRVQGCH
ncbi:MAG: hypothetical protein OEY14_10910, partial [Myxococcales bacterium]|nr:hypothetical protein [Myxococcales bacterium]